MDDSKSENPLNLYCGSHGRTLDLTSVCLASSLGCTVVKIQMVKMVEVEIVKMVSDEMIRVEMVKMVKVRMVMMVKVKRVNIVRLEMVKMVSVEMVKVEIINIVKLQMFKMLNMKMVKMIKVEKGWWTYSRWSRWSGWRAVWSARARACQSRWSSWARWRCGWCWGFLYFWRRRPPQRAGHAPPPLQVGRPAREPRPPGKPSSSVVPALSHWGGHATCFEEVKLSSHM